MSDSLHYLHLVVSMKSIVQPTTMYEKKVNTLTPTSALVTVAHCKTYDEPVEAVVDDAYA